MKQKFMTGQPGVRVSTILINCVSYSSFSLPLGLFATSFCVPSSWILSVAINGELAGRIMYGCKHKSNLGQPSSEDPHTVSINSKSFISQKFLSKVLVHMTLTVENWRKTTLSIAVDCCRQHRLCWIVRIEHSQRSRRLKVFGCRKQQARVRETRVRG